MSVIPCFLSLSLYIYLLTFEVGADRFSYSVGKELPLFTV